MKAIKYERPWNVECVEQDMPVCGKGQALIRIMTAGICGSDIGAFRGTNGLVSYPRVIGHELAGIIEEIDDQNNPKGLKKGDRVIVDPYIYCGHCYPCRIGRTNCCTDLHVLGVYVDGGYDVIFSVGQVVPHEVVGMANYSKNIFVGTGGREMINKSHMLSAICGMEKALGVTDSPARKLYDYAQQHFVDGKIPMVYLLTVTTSENEEVSLRGLYIGESRKPFEKAAELSQKLNIVHVEKRAAKVVTYLDPAELKTTWVGNKGVYRTRMIIEDGGELIVLAPGVRSFGENEEMDRMTRTYGYTGTDHILDLYRQGVFEGRLMAAAHLMQGSSEGRFSITYATKPEYMSKEEIESVGYQWADYNEITERYDPAKLREGWNTLPDGEEIYYVGTPALGLWKCDD